MSPAADAISETSPHTRARLTQQQLHQLAAWPTTCSSRRSRAQTLTQPDPVELVISDENAALVI